MCTYVTESAPARGSGKGAQGWFPLSTVTAYFDHPVHADDDHTMNLDFANPGRGASSRVAVELSASTAVDLVKAIATVLSQVPGDLTGIDPGKAAELLEAARALELQPLT